jgi:hypothetical protein
VDLATIVVLGGSALLYLVATLALATTPMGRVRAAALRGHARAEREYRAYLGWLVTLLFGGPVVIVALWAVAFAWPEPWRAFSILGWAMLFGLPASAPGALAVGGRLTLELSRSNGASLSPRCPVPGRLVRPVTRQQP